MVPARAGEDHGSAWYPSSAPSPPIRPAGRGVSQGLSTTRPRRPWSPERDGLCSPEPPYDSITSSCAACQGGNAYAKALESCPSWAPRLAAGGGQRSARGRELHPRWGGRSRAVPRLARRAGRLYLRGPRSTRLHGLRSRPRRLRGLGSPDRLPPAAGRRAGAAAARPEAAGPECGEAGVAAAGVDGARFAGLPQGPLGVRQSDEGRAHRGRAGPLRVRLPGRRQPASAHGRRGRSSVRRRQRAGAGPPAPGQRGREQAGRGPRAGRRAAGGDPRPGPQSNAPGAPSTAAARGQPPRLERARPGGLGELRVSSGCRDAGGAGLGGRGLPPGQPVRVRRRARDRDRCLRTGDLERERLAVPWDRFPRLRGLGMGASARL